MRILDLFCGAGGAAMGLHRYFPDAEIVGVDIAPQKHYPFTFEQADAMTYPLDGFDFVWASPPCQGYSVMRHLPWNRDKVHPLLIEATRERLEASRLPYLIENVAGAQKVMRANWLCGTMFGKRFYRHRLFASNFMWLMPGHETHRATIRAGRTLAGRARDIIFTSPCAVANEGARHGIALGIGHQPGAALARSEMGVEWMTADEMGQAVPPCYSEYLAQFIPVGTKS